MRYERIHFYFVRQLKAKQKTDYLSNTLMKAIEFYCAGIVHLLEKWNVSEMVETPEEFSEMLCSFIPAVIMEHIED